MSTVTPPENQPETQQGPDRLTFTSVPALMTAVVLSATLLIFALYGWYAIGTDIRSQMSWAQGATLLFFVIAMIALMLSIGYSRLWADEKGVTIRNGPVLRKIPVSEIAGLRLRNGDPWAYLLVKDGTGVKRRAVLAIQQLEGARGKKKMRQLRNWLKTNGATSAGIIQSDE